MKNDGWTLSDLAGELWARGIDLDDVTDGEIQGVLHYEHPEQAAYEIAEPEPEPKGGE